ncbi:G-protein coupled receptor family C group 6 member A [Betta splendens]|uniref:G-protein coupled receptor family C group 6 member A n=1 Tax=Betta splendens TaxID=158456 RepID=A0A6P7KV75_BETSP|nr:G-protein coupled receptor family C group 6 member A [Betta splendens]
MAWVSPLIFITIMLKIKDTVEETRVARATAPGDVIIVGLFSIHEGIDKKNTSAPEQQPCIRFDIRGLIRSLAMINAIELMNQAPLLTRLNVTLGYHIVDYCADDSTALRATESIVQRDQCHTPNATHSQPVVAVIGAAFSETSIAIARQLTLRMIPQISYSSTAAILSDKSRFPAFMRTIPNDEHQTAAMVGLLHAYAWSWVGIITTDGDYGRSALDNFMSQAPEKGICVAFRSVLPQSVTRKEVIPAISHAARTILQNPKVQVIVSFASPSLMTYLYQELKNQTLNAGQSLKSIRRVWLASDSWSSSSFVKGNLTLSDIGHVVGFTFKNGDLSSFSDYLSRLKAGGHRNNPFLQELHFQLSSKDSGDMDLVSSAVESLQEHSHANTILSTEMAVSAVAKAVACVCQSRDCKAPSAVQPWEVLNALLMEDFTFQNKSYKFDSSGDINTGYDVILWRSDDNVSILVDDIVAEYHLSTNNFTYTNGSTSQRFLDLKKTFSKCSNSCIPGEFKKTMEGQHTCCYECIRCAENYFSNRTDMDSCLSCDADTQWSPAGSSRCEAKELLFFSWEHGFAMVLLGFCGLGIILALLVSALFLHQRETPVVKAGGGPLSQVILFSLVMSYISAILFVGRPSSLQCKARQVLYGISFTICVSCILVKTLQILLAFQLNPELQGTLQRIFQPYVIVSVCVSLQTVTCICWLFIKSPFNYIISNPTTLLEDCHEGSYLALGAMLGYIALLALVCFICAFKGRKLPQQYNEGQFITFSMLLYLISWLLFIPIYVTTSGVYLPAVEMVVILISNYGILSCHFFPKCYIILFKKEQNTKQAFRKELYEYSRRHNGCVCVWGSSVSGTGSHQSISVSSLSLPQAHP